MKKQLLALGLLTLSVFMYGCTPNRGCTQQTADNYDPHAEEDDGTCIPARDKLIGNYRYTRLWTDVLSGDDLRSTGTVRASEANTGHNHFNLFFDGSFLLQGSISQNNIVLEDVQVSLTSRYTSGTGQWLENDTVDMVLNITYVSEFLPAPQPYSYYCTKLPE